MKNIIVSLKNEKLLFDGAMGTMLQKEGLPIMKVQPEYFNFTHSSIVSSIHQKYVDAGADIITTNTFQANSYKFSSEQLPIIIEKAIDLARKADPRFIAYDMGPIGKLMEPVGDLTVKTAYKLFKEQALLAEYLGADLIILETMYNLLETKAAILAVKENTSLPIFVTMTANEFGELFGGVDAQSVVSTFQALGADAIGVNCSFSPESLLPLVGKLTDYAEIPIIVQANAGLPKIEQLQNIYPVTVESYTDIIQKMLKMGVQIIGGCCGTTPGYTVAMRRIIDGK